MKTGIEQITAERKRQIDKKGWDAEHDDGHVDGELAQVAICYATPDPIFSMGMASGYSFVDPWPENWDTAWDKRLDYGDGLRGRNSISSPYEYEPEERIDLLAKAGALIAAEIDRLQRLEASK
jgi:hypothetical protein